MNPSFTSQKYGKLAYTYYAFKKYHIMYALCIMDYGLWIIDMYYVFDVFDVLWIM